MFPPVSIGIYPIYAKLCSKTRIQAPKCKRLHTKGEPTTGKDSKPWYRRWERSNFHWSLVAPVAAMKEIDNLFLPICSRTCHQNYPRYHTSMKVLIQKRKRHSWNLSGLIYDQSMFSFSDIFTYPKLCRVNEGKGSFYFH